MVKNVPANTGDAIDVGSAPGSQQSPAGGNGNPFLFSSLGNFMGRGAWHATVHRVTKSQTQLSTDHTREIIRKKQKAKNNL